MTAPTPLDQDDLAARAAAAGVPVEFDAEAAYATIGGRVYRARLERVEARCQFVSPTPWGPAQCVLANGHDGRHAYSPSEALEES